MVQLAIWRMPDHAACAAKAGSAPQFIVRGDLTIVPAVSVEAC